MEKDSNPSCFRSSIAAQIPPALFNGASRSEEEGKGANAKSQLESLTNTQNDDSAFEEVRECMWRYDLPGSDDTNTNLLLDGHRGNG